MHERRAAAIVVEIREAAGEYRAEIPGAPDAICSSSLDDTVRGIRDALRASAVATSLSPYAETAPRSPGTIRVNVELEEERPDPVLAAYAKDIDRTLVRESLRMSFEERLLALQGMSNAFEEIRGAAWKQKKDRTP